MDDVQHVVGRYSVKWNSQSINSGESMPLGGHDVGCNIWVENNALLMYIAQSGAFDEYGNMLKAGRIRLRFDKNIFEESFSQELKLNDGCVEILGKTEGNDTKINLWADTRRSAVHIEFNSELKTRIKLSYETWREESISKTNNDFIEPQDGQLVFYHRNTSSKLLDERLKQQEIEHLKEYFPNVEQNRTSGGIMVAAEMNFTDKTFGRYIDNDFAAFNFETTSEVNSQNISIYLNVSQSDTVETWNGQLIEKKEQAEHDTKAKANTVKWWNDYWKRSYVYINNNKDEKDIDWQVGRNYQLFRYMLACNAYGEFPTKFNGGLFTIDQNVWGHAFDGGNPDHRDWGGIMFTAQNQRLVYWPMIKNGDFDMMKPEFDFYKRLVTPIKKRTEHFFNIKDAACYCEQIDANGLSSHYGKFGVDYPLQVRHHHVQALEFAFMMINYHKVSGNDISEYIDFIMSVLNFYDYNYNKLDERGKRIIFPSTAMETYHAEPLTEVYGAAGREAANYNEEETAVTNPADLIAALDDSITELLKTEYFNNEQRERLTKLKNELPPIPREIKKDKEVVSPCEYPKKYYKGNCEIPQLNTVHPYNIYGINKPDLQLAKDTYFYAWDAEDQLSHISWHPNGIYAARIGLSDEAQKYMRLKLGDSGRRFPAFWGPGHDYTPDHNWGGSGMMGVQEMLMQNFDGKIYLLPAWPNGLDVTFKLWADNRTIVEGEYKDNKFIYNISPKERQNDVKICL